MSTIWRCGVCETVNHQGRTCTACGADLTRRSRVATAVRARITAPPPPPPPPAPLPEPVRRAINRDPVEPAEWDDYEVESGLKMIPIPGGCLVNLGPRRGTW